MATESVDSHNLEHRAVIKYLRKKGMTSKEIFEEMSMVLQNSAPSYATVQKWSDLFPQGPRRCEEDPLLGLPVAVMTEANLKKVEKLVLTDRRIKLWEIAEELQISKAQAGEFLHAHLNVIQICTCWVPKILTPFDKQRRVESCKDFLDLAEENLDDICNRIVTVDQMWLRQYDSESMQWMKQGQRAKKLRMDILASKLMATVFWDSEGILLIDYLPKESVMNGQYYAKLLDKARQAVVQKRHRKMAHEVLFLQDNGPCRKARVARQALNDTGFVEIDHPPYSPDLAPSYYFLFSNLEKELSGRRFTDDDELKTAVECHFKAKEKNYFFNGIKALYARAEKCIAYEGDYIEK